MATMQVEAGYRIELVASEPDIESPVAMDFDEDGRLFVVEMPGYPLDAADGTHQAARGHRRRRPLRRESRLRRRPVLPTGVMRWKKGVLVTAAPDLLYLEDTNGDGRADLRTVVITGFAFTNPQHTVNRPVYGLDNWIYLAHEGPAHAVIYRDLFGDQGHAAALPGPSAADARGRPPRRAACASGRGKARGGSRRSQFGHGFDA